MGATLRTAGVLGWTVAVFSLACGDAAPGDGATSGTSSGTASGSSGPGTEVTSGPGSTATTSDESSSSSSGGGPDGPPTDADFEWEEVEAVDCGERGHVVLDSGPPRNRVNLVILGDGYTADQLDDRYVEDVDALLGAMFGSGGFPNDVYTSSVNICRIDVVSNESGTDIPDEGVYVDTALDGWGSSTTRLGQVSIAKTNIELEDALSTSNVEADWVAVALNTDRWFASGGYPMVWPGRTDNPAIGVHEAGHSFHGLADEYSEGNGTYDGGEPPEINVTADPMSDKWALWLGFDQDDVGVIDFYEGGRYFDAGIWRPSIDGRMRTVGRSHNAPSIDKMISDIYAIARPIDDFSPKVQGELPPALGLRLIDESLVVVDWEVDGELVLEEAGPRIWTADLELTAGAHDVVAVVRDPTEWVRTQERPNLEMRITWPVQVPADLQPTRGLARSRPSAPRLRPTFAPTRAGAAPHGPPHALDVVTQHAMTASAELLRARAALTAGKLDDAAALLAGHAQTFGALHQGDRELLRAALQCRLGHPGARGAGTALLHRRRSGRFRKDLRRACAHPSTP